MPRRPNNRPTSIYWLVDARTGVPFYCGKTVHDPKARLVRHLYTARTRDPHRALSRKLRECDPHIDVQIVEIVPVTGDWCERERHWIRELRSQFPDAVNVADGGEGPAGLVMPASARVKVAAAHRGVPMHPNTRAALIKANTGRVKTDDERRRIGSAHKGKIVSVETREKLRVANLGKPLTPETKAKLSAAGKGRRLSPAHVEKLRQRRIPQEQREKIRATLLGKKHTEERRANIRAAVKGKSKPPRTAEHCAKIRAHKLAYWAKRRAERSTHAQS